MYLCIRTYINACVCTWIYIDACMHTWTCIYGHACIPANDACPLPHHVCFQIMLHMNAHNSPLVWCGRRGRLPFLVDLYGLVLLATSYPQFLFM